MRQAGRYHRHYQRLRARHEFMRSVQAARSWPPKSRSGRSRTSASMRRSCSPICCFRSRRWAWACATSPGRSSTGTCAAPRIWRGCAAARHARPHMAFQAEAIARAARRACRADCALIGFVGGPFTLYAYAVGRLARGLRARAASPGSTTDCTRGSTSGCASCWPPTWRCRREAGADCVAIFDTAAGTLAPERFAQLAAPAAGRGGAAVSRALPATRR